MSEQTEQAPWALKCGNCKHMGGHFHTDRNYCRRIKERQAAFRERAATMDPTDAFRFSPDAGVRPTFKACQFWEPTGPDTAQEGR